MSLETGGLGIAANSSHIRNGNKKALEEMSSLARLSPGALGVRSGPFR